MNAWEKDANISTSLVNIENNIENLDRTRYGFKFNDIPHAHRHHAKFIPKAYSIFSTTFNLGEAKPKEFEPKLMVPLSMSYDHRVIDGALAARFTVTLASYMSDIRQLVM
jgi:chloramphenicol O-acetyltransferase